MKFPVIRTLTVVFDDKETIFQLMRRAHEIGIEFRNYCPSGNLVGGASSVYPHDMEWMMFSKIEEPKP